MHDELIAALRGDYGDLFAKEAADVIERLRHFETACGEWLEKTDWVQKTSAPRELGMHRAEVLRQRIEALEAECERLNQNIARLTSNPADHRYWEGRYRDAEAELASLKAPAVAGDERDAFDLAYSCAVENGWESTKELARYMWDQAGAAWQRTRSAQTEQQPVEIQWPEYHNEGMGCGLEDRGITDRYEACRYGFEEALDQMARMLPEVLYAAPIAQSDPQGTTSDQYRAELYDEVWQLARDMGYGNVTMALNDLAAFKSLKAQAVAGVVEALRQYADDNNWCYDTCNISRDVAKQALAALDRQGPTPLPIDSQGGHCD